MLQKLWKYFQSGLSDADIAKRFGNDPETIWRVRTRYDMFREEECPDCGCREFRAGLECPNQHCITVWPKLWEQQRKRELEEEQRKQRLRKG